MCFLIFASSILPLPPNYFLLTPIDCPPPPNLHPRAPHPPGLWPPGDHHSGRERQQACVQQVQLPGGDHGELCCRYSWCLYVCLSVCLSVSLSQSLSVSLSMSACLPACLSVYLSVCLSVCLSHSLTLALSLSLIIHYPAYYTATVCLFTIYLLPAFVVLTSREIVHQRRRRHLGTKLHGGLIRNAWLSLTAVIVCIATLSLSLSLSLSLKNASKCFIGIMENIHLHLKSTKVK